MRIAIPSLALVVAVMPSEALADTAGFTVEVNALKPNGQNWDVGFAELVLPDIQVVVDHSASTYTCEDTTRCLTDRLIVPDGSFTVTIFDSDASRSDAIGKARCTSEGGSCTIIEGASLLSVTMR
jgi:hypothetical protein